LQCTFATIFIPKMQNQTKDKLTELENKLTPVSIQNRFVHLIIDSFLIHILAIGLNMIHSFTLTENEIKNIMISNDFSAFIHYIKAQYVVGVLLNFAYYFPLELYSKATFGKLLTNTRVISADGKVCNANQILLRTLCRCIPFDNISFLFTNKVGWHDSISKTRVITKLQFETFGNN
jgi:uncharacterized RDD family membrane protein YckC